MDVLLNIFSQLGTCPTFMCATCFCLGLQDVPELLQRRWTLSYLCHPENIFGYLDISVFLCVDENKLMCEPEDQSEKSKIMMEMDGGG